MANIRFLTRSKESKQVPVYIRYSDGNIKKGGIDIWVQTPFKMYPEYWNNKKQAFIPKILYSEVFKEEDKQKLENRYKELKDTILLEHGKLTAPVTKDWLQGVIDKFYYKEAPCNDNLTQYITRFIDEAKSGKRLANAGNTKKKYSYGSIRVLTGFKLSFEMFCKAKGKQYNFNDITIDFYNDFIEFFYKRKCGANYIGKHFKSLKTIMRQARDEGLHTNMEIERKAFKTISEEVEHIYLTEAELKALFDLNLSDFNLTPLQTGLKPSEIKNLPVVRDVFLVGCYTAQRFSDYKRINKSMLKTSNGKKYIELIQAKTGTKCIIPIRPECDAILQRYDYTLPKTFEQKVNTGIKLIGELAKITEIIQDEKNKGGMKVQTSIKKCDLICTHTARRSGCSNMYLAGISPLDIMKISGHKTEKEFLKYIRISKEETAVSLANHPYFSGLKVV
jgi:hypothetical protein